MNNSNRFKMFLKEVNNPANYFIKKYVSRINCLEDCSTPTEAMVCSQNFTLDDDYVP